jgi:hypothetical protein
MIPTVEMHLFPSARLLVGLIVLGSVVDVLPGPVFFPGRSGLFFTSVLTGFLLVRMAVENGGGWWKDLWARHRALVMALGLVIAAQAASAANADPVIPPALSVARTVLLGCFALAVVVLASGEDAELFRFLAYSATTVISLQIAALAVGLAVPSLRSVFFLADHHQSLGTFPRFLGVSNSPFGCGVVMLICAGLLGGLTRPILRKVLRGAALLLAIGTLSTATFAIPVTVAWRYLQGRRLRLVALGMLLAVATGPLYVHPLAVSLGPRSYRIGRLHPGYAQENLGPRYMPVRDLKLGPAEFKYHLTAYYYLARGAWSCFTEAPLFGVGARNFAHSCRVITMGMYGNWDVGYRAHNEYLGLLAEQGVAGMLATLALIVVLVRYYRWSPAHRWASAVLVGYLVSGCWGDDIFYQPPFCAFLMSSLVRDDRAVSLNLLTRE